MVYVSSLGSKITIDLAKKAQMALLLAKKVIVPVKYLDFADFFLKKSANILPKQIGVNKFAIRLQKDKQLPYGPIYNLGPVELKTFKTYIKTKLVNGFIQASKSLASAPILFVHKSNGSFCLCVNYQGLNNLIIKNWYLLPLIGKSLDWFGQVKQLIQLDLTSAYY